MLCQRALGKRDISSEFSNLMADDWFLTLDLQDMACEQEQLAKWVKELTHSKGKGGPHQQSLFSHDAQNHLPIKNHHQSAVTPDLPDLNYAPRHPLDPVTLPWSLQDILLTRSPFTKHTLLLGFRRFTYNVLSFKDVA
ncbi:uncharacterized protein G2W53_003354 [Senna tora]|uniref:Uncharacterized protein n=1 Tax=Senna tora TaxID=362788 RepID=A0A834X9M9_9FABA|nr:uncharacterized protein G2W53_003354 [Senna tora]